MVSCRFSFCHNVFSVRVTSPWVKRAGGVTQDFSVISRFVDMWRVSRALIFASDGTSVLVIISYSRGLTITQVKPLAAPPRAGARAALYTLLCCCCTRFVIRCYVQAEHVSCWAVIPRPLERIHSHDDICCRRAAVVGYSCLSDGFGDPFHGWLTMVAAREQEHRLREQKRVKR